MFYEAADFPFTSDLAASWTTVKDELLSLDEEDFSLWGERKAYDDPAHDQNGWRVFAVYTDGKAFPYATEKQRIQGQLCPQTLELVTRVPGMTSAGFSVMYPNTKINPHVGANHEVLRCHLGLNIPSGDLGITVAGETRRWEDGNCLVFDDTALHEAWNFTDEYRVVLLLDFKKSAFGL